MRTKGIMIIVTVLFILSGCSYIMEKGYTIKAASGENWSFTEGKLLFKGEEEEISYSIDYIGNDKIHPTNLTFDFLINTKNNDNKNDISTAEHLHSNVNVYLDEEVDNNYSKKDSFKDKLLNSKKEYDYECLYLKVTYEVDGKVYEEVIKLPMEKI